MNKPTVICLTPVRNEAWILEDFIKCASVWADHIIVADQNSDDGSREIARKSPKVRLIENDASEFNEPERQKLLIAAAREIPGPRLLIALDADEFLTANFQNSPEWEMVLRAVPGTVIEFQWACVLPDRRHHYIFPSEFPLGFMDDGSEHNGLAIHSPRIPLPQNTARIRLNGIKVLHLSTIDSGRFNSKIRWYQAWEFLQNRWNRRLLDLFRFYHSCCYIPDDRVSKLPQEWVSGYSPDIHILETRTQPYYRWDQEIIQLFLQHGTSKFRKLALWDVDWNRMYQLIHQTDPPIPLDDPRSPFERWIHTWLDRNLPLHSIFPCGCKRIRRYRERLIEKIAAMTGW